MATVIEDLRQLPQGSHCVSFHTTRQEAARNAASFIAGTPEGQAVTYWVPDSEVASYYSLWVAREAPDHVGCIAILPHEQVEVVDGKLRPVAEVRQFVGSHPDGVTAGGETITRYWTPKNIPDHMEYEAWFQTMPRAESRFLCPYDLRAVPPDLAPVVLRELGAHHSHVVLSASREPGARLLQLFIFPTIDEMPDAADENLGWALKKDLVEIQRPVREVVLTRAGEQVVRDWGERTTVDW
jgi:hypothetical protein